MEDRGNAIAKRECCQLCISAVEEWLRAHDEPVGTKLSKPRECRFELAFPAGLKSMELKSECPGCRLHLRQQRLRDARTGRVDEQCHDSRVRDQLVQEFQTLRVYLHVQRRHACDVAARPRPDQLQSQRRSGSSLWPLSRQALRRYFRPLQSSTAGD